MSNTRQTYAVNTQRKLVDLNGDLTNFDLTFTATSKDNAPFEIIVVDQETLDSVPAKDLEYKKAAGSISGNIVADKNKYRSYHLCLRADQPCSVDIEIKRRSIPPRMPPHTPPLSRSSPMRPPPKKKAWPRWKIIAIAVVIIGGVALLYYFYTGSRKKKKVIEQVTPSSPAPSVASSIASSVGALSPGPGGLLDKLRNLSV